MMKIEEAHNFFFYFFSNNIIIKKKNLKKKKKAKQYSKWYHKIQHISINDRVKTTLKRRPFVNERSSGMP